MTNFVNLTPHPITIRKDGVDTTFQPSGKVARVNEMANDVEREIDGIPILRKSKFTDIIDLPEAEDGTAFIVSGMVADRISRSDVFAPGTGPKDEAIRNDKGHIIAVKFLKSTL
jgi:hypothetical protein